MMNTPNAIIKDMASNVLICTTSPLCSEEVNTLVTRLFRVRRISHYFPVCQFNYLSSAAGTFSLNNCMIPLNFYLAIKTEIVTFHHTPGENDLFPPLSHNRSKYPD